MHQPHWRWWCCYYARRQVSRKAAPVGGEVVGVVQSAAVQLVRQCDSKTDLAQPLWRAVQCHSRKVRQHPWADSLVLEPQGSGDNRHKQDPEAARVCASAFLQAPLLKLQACSHAYGI